jgi:type IV secretion system protein VirD4
MRNYAGHRLAPWLAHVMVSRQETSRPLLTPGEVMQLPPSDELVLVSGLPPIRATKLRYFQDRNFTSRLLPPPALADGVYADRPDPRSDDWSGRTALPAPLREANGNREEDTGTGLQQQRQPALPSKRRARQPHPDQLELIGPDEDDANPAIDAAAMDRLRPLAPVLAAHALNEGSGPDLMPSF